MLIHSFKYNQKVANLSPSTPTVRDSILHFYSFVWLLLCYFCNSLHLCVYMNVCSYYSMHVEVNGETEYHVGPWDQTRIVGHSAQMPLLTESFLPALFFLKIQNLIIIHPVLKHTV